ncbi:MAG TPA: hypothetical protein VGG72_11190 [Bryobacteraceae bacterium]
MSALLFTALPAVFAGSVKPAAKPTTDLTVILDFKGPHSPKSVAAMERETQAIFKGTGVRLEWRSLNEASSSSITDLVVVSFNGSCELPHAPLDFELGPLASTYETDGQVQPFSEVSCDRVGAFVRSGLRSGDFAQSDSLLGRALGRIVAHELVHMLTGATQHSDEGVFKSGLTVEQLVAGQLLLSPGDIERLRSRP